MTTTLEEFLKPKFGALSVGDISQKGKARIAPIFDVKGKQIKLFLAKEPVLRTPWQVSSFDGGERCSLDIRLTPELQQLGTKIDTEVKGFIEKNSERYFKNPPKDDWYKSIIKESSKERYEGTLRTKVTIKADKVSFKCWDQNRNPMTVEQIKAIQWPTTGFACQVSLKSVYFQSNSYGPMLEVDMVMIKPEDEVCPFGKDDFEFS